MFHLIAPVILRTRNRKRGQSSGIVHRDKPARAVWRSDDQTVWLGDVNAAASDLKFGLRWIYAGPNSDVSPAGLEDKISRTSWLMSSTANIVLSSPIN